MGIPNYFVQLIKNHNSIIKKYNNKYLCCHNFYIDSNSIIYDAINNIEYKNDDKQYYEKVFKFIIDKLLEYISTVNPLNKIIIAFDGIAPVAKLEQQRMRRYKSSKLKKTSNWDTCNITPGTQFMKNLNFNIKNYFNNYKSKNNCDIIISTSDIIGEGEHKIYQFIRENYSYHYDTTTIIYGLDADLIMLSLAHLYISNNLYLYRETPHFINSLNKDLFPNEKYLLDIYDLSENIKNDMLININSNEENFINDYIFICFLLGNDFLPHFPVLNLRTNGLSYLLETYKNIIGNSKEYIIKKNKINWKIFKKLIGELSENEEKYGIEEMKIRSKMEKKAKINLNDDNKELLLPIIDRKVEKYINIGSEGWQYRYYKELFDIEINDERRKQICINYLEGLEWTFKYYTDECFDWKWKYNYTYPPLLEDLHKFIPYFETEFIEKKPINNISQTTQLCYVLPRNSLYLLPEKLFKYLILNHEDWYKNDFKVQWSYCKYFWESHIEMPDINITLLENIISDNYI